MAVRLRVWQAVVVAGVVFVLVEAGRLALLPYASPAVHLVASAVLSLTVAGSVVVAVRARAAERAARLAQLETALDTAVTELTRGEALVAAGGVALPLCEDLATLVEQLRQDGHDDALTARLRGLLAQFETLAQTSRRAMRPFDLAALVDRLVAEANAEREAPVATVRPPQPVWVKANGHRLELAVRHFIARACQAADAPVMVVLTTADGQAALTIATAPSLPDEEAGPAALNWSIAQAAVAECGGTVEVADDAGGLLLKLRLPLGPAPRQRRRRTARPAEPVA